MLQDFRFPTLVAEDATRMGRPAYEEQPQIAPLRRALYDSGRDDSAWWRRFVRPLLVHGLDQILLQLAVGIGVSCEAQTRGGIHDVEGAKRHAATQVFPHLA